METSDQIGRMVRIERPVQRIISLVPSITELLYDLGLADRIVGRTKFCVHPATQVARAQIVGGTKNFHIERIETLKPDLILANKEENDRDRVLQLSTTFPVWVSDVKTLDDALDMIRAVGELTSTDQLAREMADTIAKGFATLPPAGTGRRTAYCIWKDPWMFAGGDTFIHSMLHAAGFDNAFQDQARYPTAELPELLTSGVELLLLSSEPFPFREKHVKFIRQQFPEVQVLTVDGTYFSWYGSRLAKSPAYFRSLLHNVGALT